MARLTETAADFDDHRRSYETFIRIATIAVFSLLARLVVLAIGGITHSWFLAMLGIGFAIVTADIGAAIRGGSIGRRLPSSYFYCC